MTLGLDPDMVFWGQYRLAMPRGHSPFLRSAKPEDPGKAPKRGFALVRPPSGLETF